jgi:hypothetical protein
MLINKELDYFTVHAEQHVRCHIFWNFTQMEDKNKFVTSASMTHFEVVLGTTILAQ